MPVIDKIYYTVSDSGNNKGNIVLLHGAGSNRLCWPALLRRMIGYRVFTLDLPGHGNSQDNIGSHSIDEYARQVADFLLRGKIYQVILVGHSMGGAIAMKITLDNPELAAGLGLISTGAYLNVNPEILELLKNQTTTKQGIKKLENQGFSPVTEARIIHQSMKALYTIRPGVLYGDWNACSKFDIQTRLADIQIPTWIAVGADDHLTPVPCARFLQEHIPNAKMQIIPEAGHMVILEKPEEVHQGLRDFLDSLDINSTERSEHSVRGRIVPAVDNL